MKADIISTGYIFKGKSTRKWRLFFLIIVLGIYGANFFLKENSVINSFSDVLMLTITLLVLVDSFLFTRVGELEIKEDRLVIKEKSKEEKIIDLTNIEKVCFVKEDRKFYYFQIEKEKMLIDIKDVYVVDFKNKLLTLGLKIKHRNFLDTILIFFSVQ